MIMYQDETENLPFSNKLFSFSSNFCFTPGSMDNAEDPLLSCSHLRCLNYYDHKGACLSIYDVFLKVPSR